MSNRRQPQQRRSIALAVASLVLLAGGGAIAAETVSSQGNDDARQPRTVAEQTTPDAAAGTGSTAGTAEPSASGAAAPAAVASTPAGGTPSAMVSGGPSVTATASARARTGVQQPAARSTTTVRLPSARVFTGRAFDTCTAPNLKTMAAWRKSSPYGAAAVYIGGRNRGCAQPQLTSSWVRTVHAAGWQLIPLYVGAQPPCQTSRNPERITAANAASLGAADGADAVAKASALGMRSGSAIYLDMEAYDIANASCVQSVLTYVQAWNRAAHAKGYLAGFYGFSQTSAAAIATAAGRHAADLPDALWYARYDNNADTTTGFPFASGLWTGHRRGHQYAVNKKESFGGATVTVDHNAWDAPVAVVN